MVIAYLRDDRVYLPVVELFDLMMIDHQVNAGISVIFGRFGLSQTPYELSFKNNSLSFGDDDFAFTADQALLTELDYYLQSDLYNQFFGLDFTVDLNNLTLTLIPDETLPIVDKLNREFKRQRMMNNNVANVLDYPVYFDRDPKLFDGGFIDYNLNFIQNNDQSIFNYNTSIGMEVFGGDLQGSIVGVFNPDNNLFTTQNLRWRQVFRENLLLTSMIVGQTASTGLLRTPFSGVQLSNQPIEPRRLYDEYQISGTTEPQSEVEVYLNNSLVDFQNADEFGNYRFLVPLTYGVSQFDLRIYEPAGRITSQTQRLQIPFTFIPEGEVNYNMNIGRLDNPLIGADDRGIVAQTDVSSGVTDWLTTKVGVEYFQDFHDGLPTIFGGFSSRIGDYYLFSTDYAHDTFLRTNFNVIYPNASSINFGYTAYFREDGIYNPTRLTREYSANFFYPIIIGPQRVNVRLFTTRSFRSISKPLTRYRFDLNTRVGKLNMRFGFSDTQVDDLIFNLSRQARIFTSATYTFTRSRTINPILRGTFLRGQISYFTEQQQLEQIEMLASRNITRNGRVQVSASRNFLGGFDFITAGVIFDFLTTRSNTTFRSLGGTVNFSQNQRGSIGIDTRNNNWLFTSREQVGRGALAVRLYVDENNSGDYDENDTVIPDNALRLDRSGFSGSSRDGIQYYTQIQSYFKYNAEINKSVIQNPLLVPELEKFGFIADPNYFKPIEIPFYSSGVIEGIVERIFDGARAGVGGLKMIVEGIDNEFYKEIRTFSDGTFYDYELPPGKYEIYVDSTQLEILEAVPNVDKIEFEIERLSEGDFVDGLYFELYPKGYDPENAIDDLGIGAVNEKTDIDVPTPVLAPIIPTKVRGTSLAVESREPNKCSYRLQVGAYSSKESAELVATLIPEISPAVIYNRSRDLYTVRGGYYQTMGSSARQAKFNRSAEFPDIAVVNKCYDQRDYNLTRGEYAYVLQFAAYVKEHQARQYTSQLNQKFDLGAKTIRDEDRLYKVRLGPFYTLDEARSAKTSVLRRTGMKDLYLTRTELTGVPELDVDFEYLIQVGEFPNEETANEYAAKILSDFGLKCKIVLDEVQTVQLVIDKVYTDWMEVVSIKQKIGETNGYQEPILQLMEQPVSYINGTR